MFVVGRDAAAVAAVMISPFAAVDLLSLSGVVIVLLVAVEAWWVFFVFISAEEVRRGRRRGAEVLPVPNRGGLGRSTGVSGIFRNVGVF